MKHNECLLPRKRQKIVILVVVVLMYPILLQTLGFPPALAASVIAAISVFFASVERMVAFGRAR